MLIFVGFSVFSIGGNTYGVLIIVGGILLIGIDIVYLRKHIKKSRPKHPQVQTYLHNLHNSSSRFQELSSNEIINKTPFQELTHTNKIKTCPSCFSVYNEDTKFCSECGTSLEFFHLLPKEEVEHRD